MFSTPFPPHPQPPPPPDRSRATLASMQAALDAERARANTLERALDEARAAAAAAAAARGSPPRRPAAPRAASPPDTSRPPSAPDDGDTALVPRAALELLKLKDQAMDTVLEGITIADARVKDMPLIYVNRAFARITGYSVTDAIGKNCRFLQGAGTDAAEVARLRSAVRAGRPAVVQLLNYRKNGDPFVNYLSVTPIHDASGTLTHYVGVQSDISELVARKRAELAARHAAAAAEAATEAKSQFLARMSHEIRTPLNGMIAVGQLLADTALTPAQWDLVNTVRASGEALLTLVTDILDFSRAEADSVALTASEFALESAIEAAVDIAGTLAARKRLQVAYSVAKGTPRRVVGDGARLGQVLLNVLNNAVKFTDTGCILLEVWADPPARVRACGRVGGPATAADAARAALDGGDAATSTAAAPPPKAPLAPWPPPAPGTGCPTPPSAAKPPLPPPPPGAVRLRFAVRDTGIGIGESDLPRLFQSFMQVRCMERVGCVFERESGEERTKKHTPPPAPQPNTGRRIPHPPSRRLRPGPGHLPKTVRSHGGAHGGCVRGPWAWVRVSVVGGRAPAAPLRPPPRPPPRRRRPPAGRQARPPRGSLRHGAGRGGARSGGVGRARRRVWRRAVCGDHARARRAARCR